VYRVLKKEKKKKKKLLASTRVLGGLVEETSFSKGAELLKKEVKRGGVFSIKTEVGIDSNPRERENRG